MESLSVIKEDEAVVRRFTKKQVMEFRKKIADKDFFQKL
jgi:hypothetical protein